MKEIETSKFGGNYTVNLDSIIEDTTYITLSYTSRVTYIKGGDFTEPSWVRPNGDEFLYTLPKVGSALDTSEGRCPVVGNGIGIGFTNGTNYGTLYEDSDTNIINNTLGCVVGSPVPNNGNLIPGRIGIGVPTKEQLEANGGLQNSGLEAIITDNINATYHSDVVKAGYKLKLEAGKKYYIEIHKVVDIFDEVVGRIYPVGSIYTTIDKSFNPNTQLVGVWEKIQTGRFLQQGDGEQIGGDTLIEAGLPNITGKFNNEGQFGGATGVGTMDGCFYPTSSPTAHLAAHVGGGNSFYNFDASKGTTKTNGSLMTEKNLHMANQIPFNHQPLLFICGKECHNAIY